MDDLDQLLSLRKRAEKLQRDLDREKGAAGESLKRLKKEFGCTSITEAEKLLKKKQKSLDNKQEEYESLLETYSDKWQEKE